ncbi:unnamed protein product [Spirodela intermedia]|uniref:Probable purine permease n=1 Tax=Spirodela intermedia TaxID=51605 RepID=A0A7I8IJG6_SPIIN|nr:unnamed protein product [Spirodela intermedia]CAA6658029.1 unnamed protein product [Spirodela intermedia]
MAIEAQSSAPEKRGRERKETFRRVALILSIIFLVVGAVGAPLLTRIYFLHGGSRVWVTTFVQFIAFPLVLPLLYASYLRRRQRGERKLVQLSAKVTAASVGIGIIAAADAYLYTYGQCPSPCPPRRWFSQRRQKFTAFSVNAIVLLVIGAVLLGVQSSGDRPPGVSDKKYYLSFFAMIGAAVLYGLMMPLIQWTYWWFKQKATLTTVMEMQVIMSVSGIVFSAVAMIINKDFPAIKREAEQIYELGETKYYLVLVGAALFWQMMTLGFLGVICCSSGLFAGVIIAMLLPVGEIMPVLLLDEQFTSAKGIATALCFWGFLSYLYGERQQTQEKLAPPPATAGLELMAPRGSVVPAEATP